MKKPITVRSKKGPSQSWQAITPAVPPPPKRHPPDELMERSYFVFVLRSGQLGFDTEGKPPRGLEVSGDATEFYP